MLCFLVLWGLYNMTGTYRYSTISSIPIFIFFILLFFVIFILIFFVIISLILLFIKALCKIYFSSSAIYFMNSHDNDKNKRIKRIVAHILFGTFLIILVMFFSLIVVVHVLIVPLFELILKLLNIISSLIGTALLFYVIPLKYFNPPILVPFKFRSNKIRSKIRFLLWVAINLILAGIIGGQKFL